MKTKFVLIFLFIVCCTTIIFSMPPQPPGGGPGGHPDCWPPPCVPIDGGISLLIAAGAIYGGKKLYDARKEKNTL
ncbi:MAG: hypothetical protein IT237_03730 [Bacteroidia bacterium]|nr:hypothetical protein [Bacteroidia bacterium]